MPSTSDSTSTFTVSSGLPNSPWKDHQALELKDFPLEPILHPPQRTFGIYIILLHPLGVETKDVVFTYLLLFASLPSKSGIFLELS